MSASPEFVIHPQPVWRKEANFLIRAELGPDDLPWRFEQLWARRLENNRFEICCIPFFISDIALGDIVVVRNFSDFIIDRVIDSSGHFVFRVIFSEDSQAKETVLGQLAELSALWEWSSDTLLAIDAVDATHAELIANYLAEAEESGGIEYDTGRS